MAAAAQERGPVPEVVGGVVAHLLERGEPGEDRAFARGPLRLLDLLHHVLDDRLVQGRLLAGQWRVDPDVQLVRQVGDHPGIRFEATQHERRGQGPQPRGRGLVAVRFDGHSEPRSERARRPEQTRVGEVEYRPQLVQPVLDRRARKGDTVLRRDRDDRAGDRGGGVLDGLGLVGDESAPRRRGEELGVTRSGAIRREDEVGGTEPPGRVVAPLT